MRTTTWHGSSFNSRRAVLLLIGISFALRLALAASIGLGVDESYVVAVSRFWSLSYFDHPPLHFWLVRAAAVLTGSEHPVVLRLPFVLLFAATTWLMYWLTARLFGERAGFYAALIMNLSAVFSLSTGSWVLPDGPLMFFMLAAATILERILFSRHEPSIGLWLLFGLLTGLAMLSKYHAVFLLAGLFVYLLTSARSRRLLLTVGPYLAAVAALLVFSPVLIWNYQHEWVSFLFHSGRAAAKGFAPGAFAANIAGQAVWLLPWIWLPLIWTLIGNIFAGPEHSRRITLRDRCWWLCCLASGPIVLFTIATLWGSQGLFHWQAPGYLLAFPLLGYAAAEKLSVYPRLIKSWLRGSAVIFLLLVSVLASHTATGWLQDVSPEMFRQGDPTLESLNWSEVGPALRLRGYLTGSQSELFVVAGNWIEAGKLDYALGGALPVVLLSNDPHHYPFMRTLTEFTGKNALLIGREATMQDVQAELGRYFGKLTRQDNIIIHRQKRPELVLHVYFAENFRGDYPLPFGANQGGTSD